MYKRFYINALEKRIKEPRRFIQVVTGPRQVGKTTLVHQLLAMIPIPSIYESADAIIEDPNYWIGNQWNRARRLLSESGQSEVVLCLDEVQKIPGWSDQVKREWDYDHVRRVNVKVILLGSSRLLIQKGLTESLAGRFETTTMTHWKFTEMKDAFGMDPETYTYFGGYPGAADLISDESRWKSYIRESLLETTISKDIFLMSRINKPALLKRLFELGVHYSGQIVSFTKLLGQLQDAGNTVTLSHYLTLLDQAGLLCGLEKYASQMVRKRSSSPKFQVYNPAISNCFAPYSFSNSLKNPETWGRLVESAIGSHLLNCSIESGFRLYYWRDRNMEVDFVVETDDELLAIEVKSGGRSRVRGAEAFDKQFKPNKILLVGRDGIPWQEFLQMDAIP